MTLRTLNYGNYGIFLKMGNAGFCPSTVGLRVYVRFRVYVVLRCKYQGLGYRAGLQWGFLGVSKTLCGFACRGFSV